MKEIKESIKTIYKEERWLLVLMIMLFLVGFWLFVQSLLSVDVNRSAVKIGYSDIGFYQSGEALTMGDTGGYRDGWWTELLVFPIFAVVLGVLHNLLALKIYKIRGSGMAKAFVMMSIFLVLAVFLTMGRLLGEG